MMRLTMQAGEVVCTATVAHRIAVYLDNDALIDLATGSPDRRARFNAALRRGGTLLFSLTNAIEVCGPQGASASAVREFLNDIGPNWIPLELNPWKVIEREQRGQRDRAPISEEFAEAYFKQRAYDLSPAGRALLDLSPEHFFQLGAVVDWAHQNRERARAAAMEIDEALRTRLEALRAAYEADPALLDREMPAVPFQEHAPATFVWLLLQRLLVCEAKAFHFASHDGLDFCHAVLAAAYASVATLDRHWKRRVESLPRPNGLAKVYYRPQIDELVSILEARVAHSVPSEARDALPGLEPSGGHREH